MLNFHIIAHRKAGKENREVRSEMKQWSQRNSTAPIVCNLTYSYSHSHTHTHAHTHTHTQMKANG